MLQKYDPTRIVLRIKKPNGTQAATAGNPDPADQNPAASVPSTAYHAVNQGQTTKGDHNHE